MELPRELEALKAFHGHLGVYVTFGLRMGEIGKRTLGPYKRLSAAAPSTSPGAPRPPPGDRGTLLPARGGQRAPPPPRPRLPGGGWGADRGARWAPGGGNTVPGGRGGQAGEPQGVPPAAERDR